MLSRQSAIQGFILAGIYNLVGILGFTQFFTDRTLMENDPIVFSWLGQIAIILWGLAYLSVARSFWNVPYLVVVFCLEKMLYAGAWLYWLDDPGEIGRISGSIDVDVLLFRQLRFRRFSFRFIFSDCSG